jgi:hypothetical protein
LLPPRCCWSVTDYLKRPEADRRRPLIVAGWERHRKPIGSGPVRTATATVQSAAASAPTSGRHCRIEQLADRADRYVAAMAIAEQARAAAEHADQVKAHAIAEMRAAGRSYAGIGRALGLTAAQARTVSGCN